jgi:erythromycin esterase
MACESSAFAVSSMCMLGILLTTRATAQTPGEILIVGQPHVDSLAPGVTHSYRLVLDAGAVARLVVEQRGVDIVVSSFAPDGAVLGEVDSPNGREGPEPVTIIATAAGDYRIDIRRLEGPEAPVGSYEARVETILTAEQYAAEQAMLRARRDSATSWLSQHAIRLKTVEAGHGFSDMEPLRQVVGNARLVSLGEATHGTREFFQLKHRMLEFLVSEMGFTAFAIEATMPEAFDVDAYVQTGRGDPGKALAGLYFWTWNTEEVLALIEWMRAWNADPHHARKLHFYGFDMQSPSRAARVVRDYLRLADGRTSRANLPWLDQLADPYLAFQSSFLLAAARDSLSVDAALLLSRFDQRREAWTARTSAEQWAIARQHARILSQNLASQVAPDSGFVVRDRSMAENVRWILDREGPQGRIMLWAHNGHVANDCAATVWMGCYLRRALADSMVIGGFAFNRGGFRSHDLPFSSGAVREFTVGPLEENSLDATMARAGLSVAALDLRTRPTAGPVAEWFDQPLLTRSIGAGYGEAFANNFVQRTAIASLYDMLLFVDSTSAARARAGGRIEATVTLPAAANLGFEKAGPDGTPASWTLDADLEDFDFRVSTTAEGSPEGRSAAMVRRTSRQYYGETFGGPWQRIDARPYQGKRLQLHAMVRASLAGADSRAYLWLRAIRPDEFYFTPDGGLQEGHSTRSRAWVPVAVELQVPPDAVSIDFGFALVGDGSASIDAVRLEVLP